MALTPAVFLDKDGTLIEDVPYNVDPARIRFTSHAGEGLVLLANAGFRLVIVSNQSGVARGYFSEEALGGVRQRLEEMFLEIGVELAGFYYCPHLPASPGVPACDCRKPAPGMLTRAAGELQLDLSRSWMIGDILDDVEAGHRAGCRSILLDNGHETEWTLGPTRCPFAKASDLREAAKIVTEAEALGWHVPERSEGRGRACCPACHALRSAQGRATQEPATNRQREPNHRISVSPHPRIS